MKGTKTACTTRYTVMLRTNRVYVYNLMENLNCFVIEFRILDPVFKCNEMYVKINF